MIFCFDTSAINQLHRVRDREALIAAFLPHHDVYISSLNVIEIGKTPTSTLREELRALAKRLAKDYHPLELTHHLVQQLCVAYQEGRHEVSWSIDNERVQFWSALSAANAIGEAERQELAEWASSLEDGQRRENQAFRQVLEDEVFSKHPGPRPHTPGKLVRLYMQNRMLLYDITARIYKGATGRVLPLSRLETFLEAKPRIWALYLAAQVYSVFYGSVWTEGIRWSQRHRQNPVGLLDLWAAVYMAAADVFVTNDTRNGGQYNALRWLNQFNVRSPRTKVITWSAFRRRVAAGEFRPPNSTLPLGR